MSLVLITGGLGFIGSHTCLSLLTKGLDVLIIDSLVNSSKENFLNIKNLVKNNYKSKVGKVFFLQGDLRNNKWLDEIFKKQISINNPIDSVIHFAGLKSVEESVSNPIKYWDANINSTLSLLSSMEKFNCNSIVFSSSATIYKPVYEGRISENSLKEPINPYGNTKKAIETFLKDLYISDKKRWKIINLRYFNPVGAHESGKIGEEAVGKASNLFPILGKVISGEMENLSIFGKDWPTKDGTCVRDYIHVMDLAEAHFSALQFLKNNPTQFKSINIGTGKGYTVLEIVEKYSKLNNVDIPYKFIDRRSGDASSVIADNTLALELLNWKPQKNIEDCCVDSYRFLLNKLSKIK